MQIIDQYPAPARKENLRSTKQVNQNQENKILYIKNKAYPDVQVGLEKYTLVTINSYYDAAYLLQHYPATDKLPDAILCPYDESISENILRFSKYLARDTRLAFIPFILVKNKKGLDGLKGQELFNAADDVIFDDITEEELQTKISFLKKFKTLKQNKNNQLEQQIKPIPTARKLLYQIDPWLKRGMDISIAALALIILSPILLLIGILIKIGSKGSIFYTAYRAGSNYRIFKFIKFRTMIPDADQKVSDLINKNQYGNTGKNQPVFFKVSNDPRVTPLGRFLRNTSLDELPQLFNILKGDMSLVGNRPLPLYEANTLTTDDYAERFTAPAGLTGLWQVSKRGKKEMSAEERIALDIDYARKRSFSYDFKIILHTPKALFQRDDV